MKDDEKSKTQLIIELEECRTRISKLEATTNPLHDVDLDASKSQYFSLIENSPDIIYTLDPDGHFTYVGGACEALLGFKPKEIDRETFPICDTG